MGILSFFSKPTAVLKPLPRGSFTVDREGRLLVQKALGACKAEAEDIALQVLAAFREAHQARVPVRELVVRYANLKLTARELRGGAIIFLVPQTLSSKPC